MAPDPGDQPLAFLPQPRALVSLREAREILGPLGMTMEMVTRLADSGSLGPEYLGRFGRAFERASVVGLAARPVVDQASLGELDAWKGIDQALILRQLPAVAVPDTPARPRRGVDTRPFIGVHKALLASDDPALRAHCDDAMRMYWPLSDRREQLLRAALDRGEVVPLVSTVAKLVMAVRRIVTVEGRVGPERAEGRRQQKAIFAVEPIEWLEEHLLGTWLSAGPGPASIWWDRRDLPAP